MLTKMEKIYFAKLPKNIKNSRYYRKALKAFVQYIYHSLKNTQALIKILFKNLSF